MKRLSILDALRDPLLFGSFLGKELVSWRPWMTALRVLYGLPVPSERSQTLIRECMGRDPELLPADGFSTALLLVGRRGGKSRIAACIGAYEAALAGHESKLAAGERGVVACVSPSRAQSKVVLGYIRAIFQSPMLAGEVVRETADGFDLSNNISISVLAGDYRTIRGYTLIAAIVDEAALLGLGEDAKVKSDTELIQAIKPALATTRGKLIAITTPYAKKGWVFQTHAKHHGNDNSKTLVWNAPSRTMNETLDPQIVADAMTEDLAAAKSEYLAEFRDDVAAFTTREQIEALVVKERTELLPSSGHVAFVDLSGGRNDDSALGIGHREERVVVVDLLRRYRPPSNPYQVIASMVEELKRYRIKRVAGDGYAAEFVVQAFEEKGIRFTRSEKNKSALYLELLPRINAGEIELLDEPVSVSQLANLERRTRSGGKDVVDHPRGAHDDLSNVIAGVADLTMNQPGHRGALFSDPDEESDNNESEMISHEY